MNLTNNTFLFLLHFSFHFFQKVFLAFMLMLSYILLLNIFDTLYYIYLLNTAINVIITSDMIIALYRSIFLPAVIFVLLKECPLTFVVVWVGWKWFFFPACIYLKTFYFTFAFEKYFLCVENSRLTVFFSML